jgi:hypothetical protein
MYKYYVSGHYHDPVYISKHSVSETGFCLHLHLKPTQLGPINRASPYLQTECTYVIQKVSFDGLLKKTKKIYFQTIYIVFWCTYLTLLFDIVSIIVKALIIVGHQFLYSCIVEWCCLLCKPCINGFFDLVVMELPATKESFHMQDAGTYEDHLVLSLSCMGDNRIVTSQMSWWDLALRQ